MWHSSPMLDSIIAARSSLFFWLCVTRLGIALIHGGVRSRSGSPGRVSDEIEDSIRAPAVHFPEIVDDHARFAAAGLRRFHRSANRHG